MICIATGKPTIDVHRATRFRLGHSEELSVNQYCEGPAE